MIVRIPVSCEDIILRDMKYISENCKELYIDGDKNELVIICPNEPLIEELINRGILRCKYERI